MSMKVRDGRLELRWRDNGTHRAATLTEKDVLELLGRRRTPTITTLSLEWWKANEGEWSENTRKLYDWLMGTFVMQLGDVQAGDLTPAMIEDWSRSLDTGQVAKGKAQTLLSQILNRAVKSGYIPSNPAALADRPKTPKRKQINPPSVEVVEGLRAKASPRDSMAIALMAYAGLAPVDAFKVKWLDWRGGVLSGTRQKSGERFHIPIAKVMPSIAQDIALYRQQTDPALTDPIVGPMTLNYWRHSIFYKKLGADFNPYQLRHLAISLWLRDPEITDLEAAKWAGHSRKQQDNYAHIVSQGPQRVEDAIRAARAEPVEEGLAHVR